MFDPYGDYQGTSLVGGVFQDAEKSQFIVNDPLSLNLYTFCHNNPIVYLDPSGHVSISVEKVGDSGFVAVLEYLLQCVGASQGFAPVYFGDIKSASIGKVSEADLGKLLNKAPQFDINKLIRTAIIAKLAIEIGKRILAFAQKGKNNQKDTGLIGLSDLEIAHKLKDPNITSKEKQRLQKEQKARKERNTQKRDGYNRSK